MVITEGAALDILLGVVPGAASVGSGGRHHGTADDGTGEEASEHLRAEDEADEEGREDDLGRVALTSSPGAIISKRAALVEMAMQDR